MSALRRSTLTGVGLLCVAVGLVGCTQSSSVAAVRRTGHDFAAALVRGDGSAACGLLTPSARSSVGGATDAKCEEAILNLQEGGEDPGASQVWGDAAQVRVGDDVLFLRRIGGKWLVAAAGCEPQSTGPYECKVSA